jgi:hypothetical protein
MKTNVQYCSYLAQLFLELKMLRTKFIEKIETLIMFDSFFFENLAIYEIMWKISVERGRPQMKIWRMRIACWISRATNTH